jgi:hypothetical protein
LVADPTAIAQRYSGERIPPVFALIVPRLVEGAPAMIVAIGLVVLMIVTIVLYEICLGSHARPRR